MWSDHRTLRTPTEMIEGNQFVSLRKHVYTLDIKFENARSLAYTKRGVICGARIVAICDVLAIELAVDVVVELCGMLALLDDFGGGGG